MKDRIQPTPDHVLNEIALPKELGLTRLVPGKVRERYIDPEGNLVLVTTDRVSAFDSILGVIPDKGQVLNRMSAFWFDQTKDIISNHLTALPDANVMVCRPAEPIPIEVVVRGYMTGVTGTSIWHQYARGGREIYGIQFRDGYSKNDKLDYPIITPTTKAMDGHDLPITEAQILDSKLVSINLWSRINSAALSIYQRGQKIAEQRGFLLVDTKMEFGLDENGQLMVIDELLTPDSSRYWLAETLEERMGNYQEPDNFDKEFLRLAYKQMGYIGEGPIPQMLPEIQMETSRRYKLLFEAITGQQVEGIGEPIKDRIVRNLKDYF